MQVFIVAKAPAAGRTKTRLVPPLTGDEAATLHEALLLDTLDACRAEVAATSLLCGPADVPHLRRLTARLAPGPRIVVQEGSGLADALRRGMAGHLEGGPLAIVSSDLPGVPAGALTEAFDQLAAGADIVLGPALDGGYWLVAMRRPNDAPFQRIPWSTPAVLGVTLSRAQEAGLQVGLVAPWRDVDTAVDLAFLGEELDWLEAPRTRAVLKSLRSSGKIGEPPGARFVSSRLLIGLSWRAVVEDRLVGRAGRESSYTYLAVPRATFVVPVTEAGDIVLVRQYRHPIRDWTLEVPAGSVEDGETALEAATRELAEEVGGVAASWQHLTTFYSSSAHLSLRSDIFLATGVRLERPRPDTEEEISVVRMAAAEAIGRARSGGFAEGQTALAILLAAEKLERPEPPTPDPRAT